LFITQPGLEPILRARAQTSGAEVLTGHEVVGVQQDGDGVTVTVERVDSGERRDLRGAYLVGADGAHSRVREVLGIPFEGRGVFSNSITIYFTADLWPQMGDKPISVIYINNPLFGGFFRLDKDCQSGFMVVNTVYDVEDGNAAADTTPERLVQLVRAGAGVPDLDVKIDGVARWRATAEAAETFQKGRVFLAGDAAHLMPPNGGFGGNTGIHDAHNLAWKLALRLRGVAGRSLLDTYDSERRPVCAFTAEQAYSRYVTRTAPHLGTDDIQPVAHDFEIEIGYLYRSSAVLDEGGAARVHADPRTTTGEPGSRAPHVWLERDGARISSLDLTGRGFHLLAGAAGGRWVDAAGAVAAALPGLDLEAHVVGGDGPVQDPDGVFPTQFGISDTGATLVRPDGFVAWRSSGDVPDAEAVLGDVLRTILGLVPAG
jgi:hypothetical protein